MSECEVAPESVGAVLFTHNHSDHCGGAKSFRRRHPSTLFYATSYVADAISVGYDVASGWAVFEPGNDFVVGDITVTPFQVSHDAVDCTGYLLRTSEATLFLGTDMGCGSPSVVNALSLAHVAILESNYDPVLLATSRRRQELKARIAGTSGHLSNEQAADLLLKASPRNLRYLMLAHLSSECNAPHLAIEASRRALGRLCMSEVPVVALEQDRVIRYSVYDGNPRPEESEP